MFYILAIACFYREFEKAAGVGFGRKRTGAVAERNRYEILKCIFRA
jgi:hypothetical protein